jgi:hypothetical protein
VGIGDVQCSFAFVSVVVPYPREEATSGQEMDNRSPTSIECA